MNTYKNKYEKIVNEFIKLSELWLKTNNSILFKDALSKTILSQLNTIIGEIVDIFYFSYKRKLENLCNENNFIEFNKLINKLNSDINIERFTNLKLVDKNNNNEFNYLNLNDLNKLIEQIKNTKNIDKLEQKESLKNLELIKGYIDEYYKILIHLLIIL